MNFIYVLLLIASAVIFVGLVYFFKWRKGYITLLIYNHSFLTGEKIKGKIIMDIKKHLVSNKLVVGLKCEKTGEGYFKKRLKREKKEILFDFNQIVDKKKEYPVGKYSYSFSIVVPLNVSEGLEGVSSTLLDLARGITRKKSIIKWYLYAELQCKKGIKLSKRVQISIV